MEGFGAQQDARLWTEPPAREPRVLYSISGVTASVTAGRISIPVPAAVENGRASYIIFEELVALFTGLTPNSQGAKSDLVSDDGERYEVKSYRDPEFYPRATSDRVHTSASSTFGANNHGPRIDALLRDGDYAAALKICRESGFDKNDYYVYTNTAKYRAGRPFRYIIIPVGLVLQNLSLDDPRLISRRKVLALSTRSVELG